MLLPFTMITLNRFAPEGNAVNDFGSWIRKNSARPWFAKFLQIQLRPAKCPIQNRSRRCLKGRNKIAVLPANLAACFALSGLRTRHFTDPGRRGLIAALPWARLFWPLRGKDLRSIETKTVEVLMRKSTLDR